MQQLSYWARQNPHFARFLIAFCRIALAFVGLCAGFLLAAVDRFWVFPLAVCASFAYLTGFVFYPRRRGTGRSGYSRRKLCDGLLVLSSGLCYVLVANWLAQPVLSTPHAPAATPVTWSSLERTSTRSALEEDRHFVKKIRREARHVVREIRAARQASDPGATIGLVLLSLLIVVVLGYLLIALSCAIACNGQEGLAVALLFAGLAVIILLLILLWRGRGRRAGATG